MSILKKIQRWLQNLSGNTGEPVLRRMQPIYETGRQVPQSVYPETISLKSKEPVYREIQPDRGTQDTESLHADISLATSEEPIYAKISDGDSGFEKAIYEAVSPDAFGIESDRHIYEAVNDESIYDDINSNKSNHDSEGEEHIHNEPYETHIYAKINPSISKLGNDPKVSDEPIYATVQPKARRMAREDSQFYGTFFGGGSAQKRPLLVIGKPSETFLRCNRIYGEEQIRTFYTTRL